MKFYRRWQAVSALTFDLDDTLYDNHPVIKRAEHQLREWLAVACPATTKLTRGDWVKLQHKAVTANPALQGNVTERRHQQLLLGLSLCGEPQTAAKRLADEAVNYFLTERSKVDIPESIFALLGALSSRYPLIAITNGNVDCARLGLAPFFQHILKAGIDGAAKPHNALFIKAQQQLKLPAAKILHVGDHLMTDVAGAKRAGFQACWLNTTNSPIYAQRQACVLPDIEISQIEQLRFLTV